MRILHISPSYYPATYWGGPIFSVYALNNTLACFPDISLTILTTDAAGPQLKSRLNKANLSELYRNQKIVMARRGLGTSISIELIKELPNLVRQADLVHLTATYSFPTIPTLILCRIFNKPLVWSPRGAILDAHKWQGSKRKWLKRCWEIVCNSLIRRDKVILHTTSEPERAICRKRLPRATATLIPNAVDIPDTLPVRTWLPNDQLRLMYLGRLAPKKGIENLIKAISLISNCSVSIMIYGSGEPDYTATLKNLADRLGLLGNKIFFIGHVEGKAKSVAFAQADVCVVPSYSENFCMVVAEALAHGVPVVASRGTPWAKIEEQQCGLWVENQPDSLAQAIEKIRTMDLAKMGNSGRNWMEQEFSWHSVADKMVAVYKQLTLEHNNKHQKN